MKNSILKSFAFLIPLFLTSCLLEEKSVFDKSSALRMAEAIEADEALLISAPNGWLVDYYPEKNYGMGGYVMHWKFLADGTTEVACEVGVNGVPAREVATSFWKVKPEQAPVLSFDTYNDVLQYFCEPSQADIDGLAGDYEFIIRRNIDEGENLVITGKRNGNRLMMRPVPADEDPTEYLAQVQDFAKSVAASRNFSFYMDGDSIGHGTFLNSLKAGLPVHLIDIELAVPGGEEGEEGSLEDTLPFTYTSNGIRLYHPVWIHGAFMHNFVWDEAERKYTCTDPGISMEWVCTDPPPQYDYEAFIGDFTLTYGGTSLASPTTIYSTLDVTITADVTDESYIIKGLLQPEYEDTYTIHLRYDPAAGLVLDAQKLGDSGADEIWIATSFWNGSGTFVRAVPSYCSMKSTDFVTSTSGDKYGTGYSFKLSDNSNGGYPSQPTYFTYGITFRTYVVGTTGSANGTATTIAAVNDAYRCYNMTLTKK